MRTDHGGPFATASLNIGGSLDYANSLRQVMASLVPVALTHGDQAEAMAVIQEAMSA